MTHVTGTFELGQWHEATYRTLEEGGKLTRVYAAAEFTGALSGEGVADYLMIYRPDGSADFSGVQWVRGMLDGRSGEVAMQVVGTFRDSKAEATWRVITATGELAGLSGSGRFAATQGMNAEYVLDYDAE